MKRLLTLALAFVALGPISWASINLNSSRSNSYRVIFSDAVMSKAQAKAMLEEMDKIGPSNEATVKKWLAQNFKRLGVHTGNIKEILFVPADKTQKQPITIALLTNVEGEDAALRVTCPDCARVRNSASKPNY
jgi:hypothetical protein